MPNETNALPPPVNHVFVDFENIHEIDLAVIGTKTVHFTLLLGSRQTKLDVALVEKLLHHAATVELIRLTSAGKNALDFILSYYVGRAAVADPTGHFHIVSRDAGFDPLIEHLRSKHIRAHRHEGFTTLTFSPAIKPLASAPLPTVPAIKPLASAPLPAAPAVKPLSSAPLPTAPAVKPLASARLPTAPAVKSPPKAQTSHMEALELRVLQHLRKRTTTRPGNKKKLVSYLITHLGNQTTEVEALQLVEFLGQAGHFGLNEEGLITYYLEQE